MNIKLFLLTICISAICFNFSATAATFNFSTASGYTAVNSTVSSLNGSLTLYDGQSGFDTTSGTLQTTFLNQNSLFSFTPFSWDVTAQSGSESITKSGDFLLTTYNQVSSPGAIGATGTLSLESDLIFDFSFGQFTLFTGIMASTNCLGCNLGDVRTRDLFANGSFNEISAIPLPTGLPLMAGGLILLGYLTRKKQIKKRLFT